MTAVALALPGPGVETHDVVDVVATRSGWTYVCGCGARFTGRLRDGARDLQLAHRARRRRAAAGSA